jgi:hypothetical protein
LSIGVSSRLAFAPAPVGLFCWRPDGWLARFLSGSIELRQMHIMLELAHDMRRFPTQDESVQVIRALRL